MLIEFTHDHVTTRLFFQDDAGRRRALLRAMAAAPFTVNAPNEELTNLGVMREYIDAYKLPQAMVDMAGPALKAQLEKQRNFTASIVARKEEEHDLTLRRDQLLALPVDEAITKVFFVNGEVQNAVDYIAVELDKLYTKVTSDGYTSKKIYTLHEAEMA